MKILVLEYITGGGMVTESIPESLVREGAMMLNAVLTDLLQLPGIELVTFRDTGIPQAKWVNGEKSLEMILIGNQEAFHRSWHDLIQSCDVVWPIAPETDGILERLCDDVESRGKILLTSPSHVVRQTASKHCTQGLLAQHGISVVPTYRLSHSRIDLSPPWVVKPDDGVGCEGSFIVDCDEDLNRCCAEMDLETFVIQPLIEGQSLSLSVLFNRGKAVLLSSNRQCVDYSANSIHLTGCDVNAIEDIDGGFARLATQVAKAFSGLWGYAGIDLIVTEKDILVLEINPRLTTSYVGLSDALGINVAELILAGSEGTGDFGPIKPKNSRSVFISLKADNEHGH